MNYKFSFLIMTVCVMCLFGGCSSTVSVGSHILPNGIYRQVVEVNLDKKELAQKYNDEEIAKIAEVSQNYVDSYLRGICTLARNYASLNGYLEPEKHCKYEVSLVPSKNDIDIKGIILFSSVQFYNAFNESLGSGEGNDKTDEEETVEKGLFYNKTILLNSQNPVADEDGILQVYNQIEAELASEGIEFKFSPSDANLSYDYAVPYTYYQASRIRSNADKEYMQVEVSGDTSYNMMHFVWNYEQGGDNTIKMFVYQINSIAWYVTALILVVIFGIVIYLIYLFKKMRKSKQAVRVANTDGGERTIIVDTEKETIQETNKNNDNL